MATAGSGGAGGGVIAEEQYVRAKTSVWWDIENCQVPRACDPHAIAQNISSALVHLNYSGPVSISAYGDTSRITSSVQQALSSTGIALNHVPAGVKDASDKKILVDMLLWAVDNPAPANYLLISGDRDFSNALHQLRMRRYNILLAQPQKASAPLTAAAKSVWLWTSLVSGGPPLANTESLQLSNNTFVTPSNTSQIPVSYAIQTQQSMDSHTENPHSVGNLKFPNTARGVDSNTKGKTNRRNSNQPNGSKPLGMSVGLHEDHGNLNSYQPSASYLNALPPSGVHPNFPLGHSGPSWSNNNNNLQSNYQNHYSQLIRPNSYPIQPPFVPGSLYPPNSLALMTPPMPPRPARPNFTSGLPTNILDISNLNISGYPPSSVHDTAIVHQRNGEKHNSLNNAPNHVGLTETYKGNTVHRTPPSSDGKRNSNRYPHNQGLEYLPSSSESMSFTGISSNGIWGTPGCPKPSEYVQGLIGVILLTLNTLKNEKIMPTEANITDCIRFGDAKHRQTDVKKALESAIEQQMVMKQNLGALQLYIGKNDKLWRCANPLGGSPKHYSKETWNEIQKFLTSSNGRSAIMASQCRYEAGIVLKSMCLKEFTLGDTLQILNMVITYKKWILVHQSGWQPIKIILAENKTDLGAVSVVSSTTEWQDVGTWNS